MQAGKLRHRITIQRRPLTKDSAGQRTGPWEDVFIDLPAEVRDLAGRELVSAQEIHAEVTGAIFLRGFEGWRSQIKPDMRVVSGERIFDVRSVTNPDGRNRELQLLTMEIVG
ncbi:MAG TPA: phage head closure protein [Clostridia bacterium]|nr:phage head closure protein [Clostridia bacterium]